MSVNTANSIDLGDLGTLVAPMQVGDKTYMVLCTTKNKKHTWDDYISMAQLQARFFAGQVVTEENRACEVNGHRLQLPTKTELMAIHRHFQGIPPDWGIPLYWSASRSGSGYASVNILLGYVSHYLSNLGDRYVAFEVL